MKVVLAHQVKRDLMRYVFFERGHLAAVTEGLNNADVLSITGARYAVEFEVKVSRSDLAKEIAAIKYATKTIIEGKTLAPASISPEQETLNLELASLKNKAGGWSKITKHEQYIDPVAYFEKRPSYYFQHNYTPNYFYLVVPRKLVDYAKAELATTKYGVIAYDGCRSENDHYGYFKDGRWYERHEEPEGAVWQRGLPCTFNKYGCREEIAVKKKATLIHSEKINEGVLGSILSRAVTENIRMLETIVIMTERLSKYESVDKDLLEARL